MASKVNFVTPAKQIQVTQSPDSDGYVDINFQVDVYSDGKEDWIATDSALNRFRFPILGIGGQSAGAGTLGVTFIIREDWTMLPYDTDHTLRVSGNVFTDDGRELFDVGTDATIQTEISTTLTPPGQGLTSEEKTFLENILKLQINKQTLDSDGNLIVYDDDGTTPLYSQVVTDKDDNTITLDEGTPARRTGA